MLSEVTVRELPAPLEAVTVALGSATGPAFNPSTADIKDLASPRHETLLRGGNVLHYLMIDGIQTQTHHLSLLHRPLRPLNFRCPSRCARRKA